jgi:hypothetical protein
MKPVLTGLVIGIVATFALGRLNPGDFSSMRSA